MPLLKGNLKTGWNGRSNLQALLLPPFVLLLLQAAQPRSCTLCVVVGGGARPPIIPAEAGCVKEEWLLLAAERFEAPPLEEFSIG